MILSTDPGELHHGQTEAQAAEDRHGPLANHCSNHPGGERARHRDARHNLVPAHTAILPYTSRVDTAA